MDDLFKTIPDVVLAIGGLGTAAYALVDAGKALPGGGPSLFGFNFIQGLVNLFLPVGLPASTAGSKTRQQEIDPVASSAHKLVLNTLRANWINGMAIGDQKNVARSMFKLYFRDDAAPQVAKTLGLSEKAVSDVARLWRDGPSKEAGVDPSAATVGRVDLALTALVDGVYQRADQRYRNKCKVLAGIAAVVIAMVSGATIYQGDAGKILLSILAGLIAVPLAPIAKDLASALQAGVKVAQSLRR
jgi:hypothetical protein